jgi:hypothetical protein
MICERFRENGAACVLVAENHEAPAAQAHWLMMAQAWLKLAADAERLEAANKSLRQLDHP